MMSYSSSSVTDMGESLRVCFAAAWPAAVSSAESGAKSFMKKHSGAAQALANLSLYLLAMLFGSISPAKNTTTVVISVLTDTALRPHSLVTSTVTIDATEICTMFVQISRVLIARSKLSST